MRLNETVTLMTSEDYKDRFKAEFYQLFNRYLSLQNMLNDWSNERLSFMPTCPRSTYEMQLKAMYDYLSILEARAIMENIELDISCAPM